MIYKGLGMTPEVSLMVWDTNKKTMNNEGNITKVNSKVDLKVGDRIQTNNDPVILYTVDEILDVKDSSLSGYKYMTLKTTRNKQAV